MRVIYKDLSETWGECDGQRNEIYVHNELDDDTSTALIAHELSHLRLKHQDTEDPIQELEDEFEAWKHAENLLTTLQIRPDNFYDVKRTCLKSFLE